MRIKEKVDEEIEKKIDREKDRYLEVQQEVSELRRKGKPTELMEIKLIDIPAKLKIAQLNKEENDIVQLRRAIDSIKKDVEEEINGSDFDHANVLIQEAFEHLRKDEKKQAVEKYNEMTKLYKFLTQDLKGTVYSACSELRKRLSE